MLGYWFHLRTACVNLCIFRVYMSVEIRKLRLSVFVRCSREFLAVAFFFVRVWCQDSRCRNQHLKPPPQLYHVFQYRYHPEADCLRAPLPSRLSDKIDCSKCHNSLDDWLQTGPRSGTSTHRHLLLLQHPFHRLQHHHCLFPAHTGLSRVDSISTIARFIVSTDFDEWLNTRNMIRNINQPASSATNH